MADIIVRIPQQQLRHFHDDKLTSEIAFWRFTNKPKQLNEGDFIWFTRPEGLIGGAKVIEITDKVQDSPDRSGKWNALWNGYDTRIFKTPITGIQYSQQGYRYLKESEQKRVRQAYEDDDA